MNIKIILLLILLSVSHSSCSQTTHKTDQVQHADPVIKEKKRTKSLPIAFNIKGTWKTECGKEKPSIEFFDDQSAVMDFDTKSGTLARINLNIEKNNDTFNVKFDGLTGVTKGNPDLEWVNFSREETIAEIKTVRENTFEISWFGFYNQKSKKRNSQENPFAITEKNVQLVRCN